MSHANQEKQQMMDNDFTNQNVENFTVVTTKNLHLQSQNENDFQNKYNQNHHQESYVQPYDTGTEYLQEKEGGTNEKSLLNMKRLIGSNTAKNIPLQSVKSIKGGKGGKDEKEKSRKMDYKASKRNTRKGTEKKRLMVNWSIKRVSKELMML